MQSNITYTDGTIKTVTKIPTKLNEMATMLIDKMKDMGILDGLPKSNQLSLF